MKMTKTQKYLNSLKKCEKWVTVLEWAEKVSELYPEILEDANKQVQSHATETTGLRAITARLSSKLSSNDYDNIEIDDSERPRKVRYVSADIKQEQLNEEIEADIEPLTRKEKIESDSKKLTTYEQKQYIEQVVALQRTIFSRLEIELVDEVLNSLFEKLEKIY